MEFTLLAALIAGLLGGVHCVGMCGGIVTALSLTIDPNRSNRQRLGIQLGYNLGRILSYSVLGAVAGALAHLGSRLFINTHAVQLVLQVIAALFMLALGLYLAGWWRGLVKLERLGHLLWRHIEPRARGLLPIASYPQAVIVGMVWGWLPCGLVYSILFYAMSSGTAWHGALLMFCFGLGTLPTLLTSGLLATTITRLLRQKTTQHLAGVSVFIMGLILLWRVI
ncbi:MAG: sulfite exporter TauE/SafE family protein [Gammaproteobacteria bacterium]|nr:sulfite exporter TauE/SafE family protein [Gammaproteobacteria bacterium]